MFHTSTESSDCHKLNSAATASNAKANHPDGKECERWLLASGHRSLRGHSLNQWPEGGRAWGSRGDLWRQRPAPVANLGAVLSLGICEVDAVDDLFFEPLLQVGSRFLQLGNA